MKTLSIIFALALPAAPVFADQLEGQVFVVTNSHQTIKLSLVPIVAFDKDEVTKIAEECQKNWLLEVNAFIDTTEKPITDLSTRLVLDRKAASEAVRDQAMELSKEALRYVTYLMSSQRLFEHLPPAIAATKTDADGNFSLTVPDRSRIVIGAATSRAVFDKVETYHWLVPADEVSGKIMLSNDNLASVNKPNSIYQWLEVELPYPQSADVVTTKFKRLQSQLNQKSKKP
jgi:hypothetical protein